MWRLVGGLDAKGFLAPSLSAKDLPPPVLDLFLLPNEVEEDDRECRESSDRIGRAVAGECCGEDVPNFTTFGLDNGSLPLNCSVLEVWARRTTFGLDD